MQGEEGALLGLVVPIGAWVELFVRGGKVGSDCAAIKQEIDQWTGAMNIVPELEKDLQFRSTLRAGSV